MRNEKNRVVITIEINRTKDSTYFWCFFFTIFERRHVSVVTAFVKRGLVTARTDVCRHRSTQRNAVFLELQHNEETRVNRCVNRRINWKKKQTFVFGGASPSLTTTVTRLDQDGHQRFQIRWCIRQFAYQTRHMQFQDTLRERLPIEANKFFFKNKRLLDKDSLWP